MHQFSPFGNEFHVVTKKIQNAPKYYKTLTNAPNHYENAPKHEFRVQLAGLGAFVLKNSDATSWHDLMH